MSRLWPGADLEFSSARPPAKDATGRAECTSASICPEALNCNRDVSGRQANVARCPIATLSPYELKIVVAVSCRAFEIHAREHALETSMTRERKWRNSFGRLNSSDGSMDRTSTVHDRIEVCLARGAPTASFELGSLLDRERHMVNVAVNLG